MKLSRIKELAVRFAQVTGLAQRWERLEGRQKYMVWFVAVILFLSLVRMATGWGERKPAIPAQPDETSFLTEGERGFSSDEDIERALSQGEEDMDEEEASEDSDVSQASSDSLPEASTETSYPRRAHKPYYSRPIVRWNEPEFSDLNDRQLVAARSNGLRRSMSTRESLQKVVDSGKLVYASASPFYKVASLRHSVPYLVPKAYDLLNRIAVNYMDSLQSQGIPLHQIIVTSLLRTDSDVKKLKRGNGNASQNSCHRYATTFDISYINFQELGVDNQEDKHSFEREILMKRILGEVLRDLRYEGRCYVKHESKQKCFHVTVR